jgi:deazaflavin-dependent oxidoreductase (nitroreductase family)
MTIAHIAGGQAEEVGHGRPGGWSPSKLSLDTKNERSPMAETAAQYNAKIIDEFRANGGRVGGMWEETPLLLLHHTGANSGVGRVNPVAYLPDASRYFIWAANGGAPKNPAWYHNLKTHPSTGIEVGGETVEVVAEQSTSAERDRLFATAAERYPQLAEVARKTSRGIPSVVLTPRPSW